MYTHTCIFTKRFRPPASGIHGPTIGNGNYYRFACDIGVPFEKIYFYIHYWLGTRNSRNGQTRGGVFDTPPNWRSTKSKGCHACRGNTKPEPSVVVARGTGKRGGGDGWNSRFLDLMTCVRSELCNDTRHLVNIGTRNDSLLYARETGSVHGRKRHVADAIEGRVSKSRFYMKWIARGYLVRRHFVFAQWKGIRFKLKCNIVYGIQKYIITCASWIMLFKK